MAGIVKTQRDSVAQGHLFTIAVALAELEHALYILHIKDRLQGRTPAS